MGKYGHGPHVCLECELGVFMAAGTRMLLEVEVKLMKFRV